MFDPNRNFELNVNSLVLSCFGTLQKSEPSLKLSYAFSSFKCIMPALLLS